MDSLIKRPRVSVVMPSFNQVAFIADSVKSVFSQDYPSLELVVMDGNSSDGTQAVLAGLQQVFGERLRWYSEPDGGPAHAINKALKLARGELIGWLNSDDLYASDAINRAVSAFAQQPSFDLVYGRGSWIDAHGVEIGEYPTLPPSVGPDGFQSGCYICQPTVFFRRGLLEKVGMLDESWGTVFDFDLWLRAFVANPDGIGFVDSIQAFSRLHEQCITNRFRGKVASESIRVLARYLGHAQTHWLATHLDELILDARSGGVGPIDIRLHLNQMLNGLAGCFESEDLECFRARLGSDVRLELADQGVLANVFPDGWVGQMTNLVLFSVPRFAEYLVLDCRNLVAAKRPQSISVIYADRTILELRDIDVDEFSLRLPLTNWVGDSAGLMLRSHRSFVPATENNGRAQDSRELAFQVRGCRFE